VVGTVVFSTVSSFSGGEFALALDRPLDFDLAFASAVGTAVFSTDSSFCGGDLALDFDLAFAFAVGTAVGTDSSFCGGEFALALDRPLGSAFAFAFAVGIAFGTDATGSSLSSAFSGLLGGDFCRFGSDVGLCDGRLLAL
jgi:hypothetical protein